MTLEKIPGLARELHGRINDEARRFVAAALMRGERPSSLFLHLEPDGVRLVFRRDLVRRFEDADVPELALRIRVTRTPVSCVLALVDCECTEIVAVPLASLGLRGGWGR